MWSCILFDIRDVCASELRSTSKAYSIRIGNRNGEGKLQFSEIKYNKCLYRYTTRHIYAIDVCENVQLVVQNTAVSVTAVATHKITSHMCTKFSWIRFENVIRRNFLFPIKFDKLTFYGQNT